MCIFKIILESSRNLSETTPWTLVHHNYGKSPTQNRSLNVVNSLTTGADHKAQADYYVCTFWNIFHGWKVRVVNTLRPRQNGRHFTDDIFKCIFFSENVWIPINISLKFVPKGQIKNIPALVQIMAWRRPGDKPLSEPMMVSLTTHICVTRLQWVNMYLLNHFHLMKEQYG